MAEFDNEEGIRAAVQAVRADADPTNWMAISTNGKKWGLAGKGSGGVDEVAALIKEDNVLFALFRLSDKIDESVTVKFVMLNWLGENVNRMTKARLSVQRGSIEQLLSPYHTDHTTSDKHEVSTAFFMQKVMHVSGSGSHVLDDQGQATINTTAVQRVNSGSATQKAPSAPRTAAKEGQPLLKFADEGALRKALRDVRDDSTPIDWAVVVHGRDNTLTLAGTGSGNISGAFLDALTAENVCYGLVRKEEKFDESITTKFVFVSWVGENVARMHKASLAPAKGEVDAIFAPWHVDVAATNKSEISDDIIVKRIGKTSGTDSNVLDETKDAAYYHN